eukprot:SAG11_NODE_3714_length_2265_cov_3.229455_2_plen_138_part_00
MLGVIDSAGGGDADCVTGHSRAADPASAQSTCLEDPESDMQRDANCCAPPGSVACKTGETYSMLAVGEAIPDGFNQQRAWSLTCCHVLSPPKESDVDCGDAYCAACGAGAACTAPQDRLSGRCYQSAAMVASLGGGG